MLRHCRTERGSSRYGSPTSHRATPRLYAAKPVEAGIAQVNRAQAPTKTNRGHDRRSHPSKVLFRRLSRLDGPIGLRNIGTESFGGERGIESEGVEKGVHGELGSNLAALSPRPVRRPRPRRSDGHRPSNRRHLRCLPARPGGSGKQYPGSPGGSELGRVLPFHGSSFARSSSVFGNESSIPSASRL